MRNWKKQIILSDGPEQSITVRPYSEEPVTKASLMISLTQPEADLIAAWLKDRSLSEEANSDRILFRA